MQLIIGSSHYEVYWHKMQQHFIKNHREHNLQLKVLQSYQYCPKFWVLRHSICQHQQCEGNNVIWCKSSLLLIRIIYTLKFRLTIYYRVRTRYQQFLDHTVEDFCGLLNGGKNIFMDRIFLDPARLAAPNLFHPCPYVIFDMTSDLN